MIGRYYIILLKLGQFIKRHMIVFGGGLLGIVAALIGVYAAKTVAKVELPISDLQLWIIIAIFFAFGLSISIIGNTRTWGDITPRQRKREERLKVHFNEMQEVSPNVVQQLEKRYWEIEEGNLHNFPDEFVAHFPNESTRWGNCCADIKTHNENCAKFKMKIKQFCTSQGLEIRQYVHAYETPYIREEIFHLLFIWWRDRLRNWHSPQIDFTHFIFDVLHPENPTRSPLFVRVSGWAEGIAYVGSDVDKEEFQEVISNVAFNTEFEQEAVKLINSGEKLEKSVSDLKSQIMNTIESVDKYWPGTKEYTFKKVKQCLICRNI